MAAILSDGELGLVFAMAGPGDNRERSGATRTASAVRDPRVLFETIKRRTAGDVAGIFEGFWGTIEEQVRLASLAGHDYSASQEDRVAVLSLRQRAQVLATRYREGVEGNFERWLRAMPTLDPGERSLSLMSEGELQMQLAGQAIGEDLLKQFSRTLETLEDRLAGLAAALGSPRRLPSPLRPEPVVDAFVSTFRGDDLTPGLRSLVFRQFEKRIVPVLSELYDAFNGALESGGFGLGNGFALGSSGFGVGNASLQMRSGGVAQGHAPTQPATTQWVPDGGLVEQARPLGAAFDALSAIAPDAQANALRKAEPAQATSGEGRPLRYRDIVREQLRGWRASAGHGAQGWIDAESTHVDGHVLGTEDLLSVASLLQGDDPEPFTRALSGERPLSGAIRDEILGGVRQLGFAPETTRFTVDEEDAIDLVGMLFQALFEANDLMQRVLPLYGRLVMPYVKVALTDDTLFNRRSHPARQLLDALTEACDGNAADTPQDRETLDHAERVVERVVSSYQEDLAVFDLAASELRELLEQQRRRAELSERRTAEAIHGRERLQQARAASRDVLASRLSGRPLTRPVADFLREEWRHHLAQAALRNGVDSERYQAAVALGDGLVQVDADAARARGAAVANQLLALQPAIADCFTSAGLEAASARDVLARIVSALANPDAPRQVHALPDDDEPEARPDATAPALRLVGGTDALEFDPAIAARMRRLRVGQGLRVIDDAGHESAARIAWVSPLTSRFLIVNRRGIRKLVVSPEELAALVGQGRVVVRAVDAPFDEAMKQLWQHLNRAPSPEAAAG